MQFEKKHLIDLPFCYSASQITVDGRKKFLLAPDAPGPCVSFDTETYEQEIVWHEPGGTMSMVALPWTENEFLAVQRFNPGFRAENAEVVHLKRTSNGWVSSTLFIMPFIHRFDILKRNNKYYLVCCTVCSNKEFEDDWRSPGKIFVSEITPDLKQSINLKLIADNMTRNHGYWRMNENRYFSYAIVSCDQGVFEIIPPIDELDDWTLCKIMNQPVSDIAVYDIDGDGQDEIATIEPFHGESYRIYKKINGNYIKVYEYAEKMSFVHVVWGGKLRGEPVFIGGCRGSNKELFIIRHTNDRFITEVIDQGGGPSNISVCHSDNHDTILVANREAGEGAVYIVK